MNLVTKLFGISKANASHFRPTVEGLEERVCASCNVTLADGGHTLKITGDSRGNNVQLSDNVVLDFAVVFCDNKAFGPYDSAQITKVIVNLKGGDDFFQYSAGVEAGADFAPGFVFPREINVNFGAGDDELKFDFQFNTELGNYTYGFGASLDLNIKGGAGDDDALIRYGSVYDDVRLSVKAQMGAGDDAFVASASGAAKSAAQVLFDVKGDAGADQINVNYDGIMSGLYTAILDGGQHNDQVSSHLNLRSGSTGAVKARVLGNSGNDTLNLETLSVIPYSARLFTNYGVVADLSDAVLTQGGVYIDALIDGGLGFDTFHKTANVAQVNCEVGV